MRKIISISSMSAPSGEAFILALCEDGTIWSCNMTRFPLSWTLSWSRVDLPPLPESH